MFRSKVEPSRSLARWILQLFATAPRVCDNNVCDNAFFGPFFPQRWRNSGSKWRMGLVIDWCDNAGEATRERRVGLFLVPFCQELSEAVVQWLGSPGAWQLATVCNWPLTPEALLRPTTLRPKRQELEKKREDNFWRQKTQKHENMDLKRINRVSNLEPSLSHTKIWQSVHHVLMPKRRCPLVVHVWNSQDNLNSLEFWPFCTWDIGLIHSGVQNQFVCEM